MQLQQVDALYRKVTQFHLDLLTQVCGYPRRCPQPRSLACLSDLRGNDNLVSVRVNGVMEDSVSDVRAVCVGTVEQCDTEFCSPRNNANRVVAVGGLTPHARSCELHRAVSQAVDGEIAAESETSGSIGRSNIGFGMRSNSCGWSGCAYVGDCQCGRNGGTRHVAFVSSGGCLRARDCAAEDLVAEGRNGFFGLKKLEFESLSRVEALVWARKGHVSIQREQARDDEVHGQRHNDEGEHEGTEDRMPSARQRRGRHHANGYERKDCDPGHDRSYMNRWHDGVVRSFGLGERLWWVSCAVAARGSTPNSSARMRLWRSTFPLFFGVYGLMR